MLNTSNTRTFEATKHLHLLLITIADLDNVRIGSGCCCLVKGGRGAHSRVFFNICFVFVSTFFMTD